MTSRQPPLLTLAGRPSRRGKKPDTRPFIKWVGGKRAVLPEIRALLEPFAGRYHEPFVGGGAVFFELATREGGLPAGAVLSDQNERLVRTWRAVRDRVEEVITLLRKHETAHGEAYFYATRQLPIDRQGDAEVAAWFIYLNKAGFNGLYRVNSKGVYNVPIGSHVTPNILDEGNLRAANRLLQGVEIEHQDFAKACAAARPGDAVYLDPPYVPLTASAKFTSYTRDGFGRQDQVRLAQVARELKARGVRVVLSNHDTEEVRTLYKVGFEFQQVHVRRNVNRDGAGRGKVAEVLIT